MAATTGVKNEPESGRVFVSYSRRDTGFADRLRSALQRRAFDSLLDTEDIAPGEEWQPRLGQLISEADTVVFIISPDSLRSAVCRWEVEESIRQMKRIIPVVHRRPQDEDVPTALAQLNYVFMDDESAFERQVDVLVTALEADLAWLREQTRIGALAADWERNGRQSSDLLRGAALEQAERWRDTRPATAPDLPGVQREFITMGRRRAAGWLRNMVIGSSMITVLAIGLTLFALQQRSTAIERQKEAEQRLELVMKAYGVVVYDAVQGIRQQVTIPIKVQQALLERVRVNIDQLSDELPQNISIQRLRGTLYGLAADTMFADNKLTQATDVYTKSIEYFQKVLDLSNTRKEALPDLALSLSRRAVALQRAGKQEAARDDQRRRLPAARHPASGLRIRPARRDGARHR